MRRQTEMLLGKSTIYIPIRSLTATVRIYSAVWRYSSAFGRGSSINLISAGGPVNICVTVGGVRLLRPRLRLTLQLCSRYNTQTSKYKERCSPRAKHPREETFNNGC